MKKIFRKNQIIITALALMIAVAGYISYTKTNVAENEAIQTAGDNVDNTYDISEGDQIGEIFIQSKGSIIINGSFANAEYIFAQLTYLADV